VPPAVSSGSGDSAAPSRTERPVEAARSRKSRLNPLPLASLAGGDGAGLRPVVAAASQWREMERGGARSNPRAGIELPRVAALHDELLHKASADPREPRPAPAKVSQVLETVTLVLERAGKPMLAREIHAAACELAGEPLLWSSVKGTLAAYASGSDPRFRRIRRGMYQTVEAGHGINCENHRL